MKPARQVEVSRGSTLGRGIKRKAGVGVLADEVSKQLKNDMRGHQDIAPQTGSSCRVLLPAAAQAEKGEAVLKICLLRALHWCEWLLILVKILVLCHKGTTSIFS